MCATRPNKKIFFVGFVFRRQRLLNETNSRSNNNNNIINIGMVDRCTSVFDRHLNTNKYMYVYVYVWVQ